MPASCGGMTPFGVRAFDGSRCRLPLISFAFTSSNVSCEGLPALRFSATASPSYELHHSSIPTESPGPSPVVARLFTHHAQPNSCHAYEQVNSNSVYGFIERYVAVVFAARRFAVMLQQPRFNLRKHANLQR